MPISATPSVTPGIRFSVKIILLVASSMTVLAAAILAPSLPGISAHFSDQPSSLIPLVITLPALSIALSGGLAGRLGDRFGRKPVLIGALALYALAGASGYVLEHLPGVLIGRVLLGVAMAGILSMTTTLIGDYFPPAERARFLGLQGAAMTGGGLVFLNLGGVLAEWSWRGPFLVYLSSLLLIPLVVKLLPEPAPARRTLAQSSPVESRNRLTMGVIYMLAALGMGLLYVVPTQLPFLITEQIGAGSSRIAFAISTTTVTATLMALVYGRLSRHLSPVRIYALAFLFIALGYGLTSAGSSFWSITLGIALSGIGLGLFMPNGAAWLMRIVPADGRAPAIGRYAAMLFLGQFLSPLLLLPVTAGGASLSSAFLVAALAALGLAIVTALMGMLTER